MDLAKSVLDGNRLALAKCLTLVENETQQGRVVLDELYPYTGRAHLVGITGAPGTGKSSLVNQIARIFRKSEEQLPSSRSCPFRVAIVAIDPTSPFTGGAILGDRVRMRDLAGDPGIFIRSMATRGSLGGLAPTTAGMVQVLDAAGFEVILIETVGAGQAEVDIARLAHTTLVVEAPGFGDEIQAIKAGILEIADILVINKADRPGVDATERALRSMLELAHPPARTYQHHGKIEELLDYQDLHPSQPSWTPPILRTVATDGKGLDELICAIDHHFTSLQNSGEWRYREQLRLKVELDTLLQNVLVARWRSGISDLRYHEVLHSLFQRTTSPWKAVEALLEGGQG
jgi:LAO/AO transport system kinase